jgi:polyhydroxybutyrate depolymerase
MMEILMFLLNVSALFVLVLLTGCDGGGDAQTTNNTTTQTVTNTSTQSVQEECVPIGGVVEQKRREIDVNGVTRAYTLSVSEVKPGVEMPMLIAINGAEGNDYPFPQQTSFEALAASEGVILVRPESDLLPPNEGEWILNTTAISTRDIDFMKAMIADIATGYCVDFKRIYATGYSLGSMFNYELVCHMSDYFAAVASHAGSMPVQMDSCPMKENVAIMHIHNVNDWLIDYDLPWDWKEWDPVGTMMDVPALVTYWGDRYGCQDASETVNGDSTHIVHDNCDGGVRVEHHAMANGIHEWPNTINGTQTAEVVWDFLSEFSKP